MPKVEFSALYKHRIFNILLYNFLLRVFAYMNDILDLICTVNTKPSRSVAWLNDPDVVAPINGLLKLHGLQHFEFLRRLK